MSATAALRSRLSFFDLLLGNPPYNLYFDGCLSQLYFCRKACDLLNPED